MGNHQSSDTSSTTDIENRLSENIREKVENDCVISTKSTNELNITGSTVSGSNITLTNKATGSCKMKAALNELMKTKSDMGLAKKIAENQMASGGIFNSNKSNTELYTKMSTVVDIDKMLEVVNSCMQNVDLKNIINITDATVMKSNIELGNTSFNDCLQESLLKLADEHDMTNEAEDIIEKTQTAKGGSLFGGKIIKMAIWGLIGVIILFLIMRYLCRSKFRFVPPFMLVCKLPFLGAPDKKESLAGGGWILD